MKKNEEIKEYCYTVNRLTDDGYIRDIEFFDEYKGETFDNEEGTETYNFSFERVKSKNTSEE